MSRWILHPQPDQAIDWPLISRSLIFATLILGLPELISAQSSFRVGNFGKSQDAAPTTQVVTHNLGEKPKALLIWTAGGWTINYTFAMGFSDSTTSKSMSAASKDQRSIQQTHSSLTNKALTIVEWDGGVAAESDLVSWDDSTFTLNWTTNNTSFTSMHYIIIGGSDVTAKVIEWSMPAATDSIVVDMVGFEPDVVLHGFARESAATPNGVFGLGVMCRDGSQWANTFHSVDGVSTTNTQRCQTISACIQAIDSTPSVQRAGHWATMDPSGFSIQFTVAPGWALPVASLALRGISAHAGGFYKSADTTVPVSQPVTGAGFQPQLLLFSSFQDVAQATPVVHTRYGFGAADGTSEGASTISDEDGLSQSDVHSIDNAGKAFIKVDNVDGVIDAAADLASLDGDGFTLSWTTNDTVATEILYLAIGATSSLSVSIDDPTLTFGVGPVNQWLPPDTCLIINDGTVAENIVGQISQFSDGSNSWDVSVGTNGADSIRAQWSTTSAAGPWTDISAYDSDFTVVTNIAVNDTVTLYFRIQTPTSSSSFNEYLSTLTVTAQEF